MLMQNALTIEVNLRQMLDDKEIPDYKPSQTHFYQL